MLLLGPEGKNVQPVNFMLANFFGPTAFELKAREIALECHGFASAGAVTTRMALGVL